MTLTTWRYTGFMARLACVVGFAFAVSAASAQSVFKCTEGGKTVYQAEPCSGTGRAVSIQRGPSETDAAEAKRRADEEKARAAAGATGARGVAVGGDAAPRPAAAPQGDCAQLNQQRADAYGRRNNTVRNSRKDNLDNSAAVDRYNADIERIESQMRKSGCKPT